jgi:hypothetical protein
MWEPRSLTTLWTSTACYRDSFTFNLQSFRWLSAFRGNVLTPYSGQEWEWGFFDFGPRIVVHSVGCRYWGYSARGIICDAVNSSELAQKGVKWRTSVITGIKLRVPNRGCFENTATTSVVMLKLYTEISNSVEMVCSRTANWKALVAPSDRKATPRAWIQWARFMTTYAFR